MDLESRYELLETIGNGSYATVYRARDRELGREVAIKQIHDQYLKDPDQLERYWQEAQLLASLQHPNIVTIYDIYRERGWLILELMQANLGDRLSGRQMDLKGLKTTLAHCLRALKYLHSRGVIHGDVKPGNVMLDHRKRIKLGDFGLARRASDEEGSLLKGTTKYMAPEVVSEEFGEVGPASDLYSLGFAAYEMMCGSENFEQLFPGLSAFGRNKQVAWMMWHAAPDRRLPEIRRVLQGVPDDVARVIQRLVEKDQAKRYKSADEALADLNVEQKAVRDSGTVGLDEGGDQPNPEDAARRKRLWLAGGAFGASFLLCAAMLFLPGGGQTGTGGDGEGPANVGVVRGVDSKAQVIKLADVNEGVPLEDLKVGAGGSIFLETEGEYVEIGDLKSGDRVTWESATGRDGGQTVKVRAFRPTRRTGVVRNVDRAARRVEILAEDERGQRTGLGLRIPERATVLVNGVEIKDRELRLEELKVGDAVVVSYLPEPKDKTGRVVERLEVRKTQNRSGFVVAIDAEKRTLTVRLGRDALADQISLPVASKAKLLRGEELVALADLQPEDAVRVEFDTEIHHVEILEASGPVAAIDYDERTLTLNTKGGERTVTAGTDCEVVLAGETAAFADLRRSDEVAVKLQQDADGSLRAARLVVRRPAKADRAAILVAVEKTADSSLPWIPHAVADVRGLQKALQTRYAVSESRVTVLLNKTAKEIRQEITRRASEATSGGELIVYVVGHGLVDGDRVLLPGADFDAGRADETAVPLDAVTSALQASPARDKLLLLDCTHTKSERQPATAEMVETLGLSSPSFTTIASTSEGQQGLDWEEERSGLFAHFLAAGYSGAADADRDLRIAPRELFGWLKSKMSPVRGTGGEQQEPVLFEAK